MSTTSLPNMSKQSHKLAKGEERKTPRRGIFVFVTSGGGKTHFLNKYHYLMKLRGGSTIVPVIDLDDLLVYPIYSEKKGAWVWQTNPIRGRFSVYVYHQSTKQRWYEDKVVSDHFYAGVCTALRAYLESNLVVIFGNMNSEYRQFDYAIRLSEGALKSHMKSRFEAGNKSQPIDHSPFFNHQERVITDLLKRGVRVTSANDEDTYDSFKGLLDEILTIVRIQLDGESALATKLLADIKIAKELLS